MQKVNKGFQTSRHQRRAEAAIKRRAKRKEARAAVTAPLRKLLAAKDAQIAALIEQKRFDITETKETPNGEVPPTV